MENSTWPRVAAPNEPFFRQTGTCCKEPGDFIKEAQVGHGQGSVPSHLT